MTPIDRTPVDNLYLNANLDSRDVIILIPPIARLAERFGVSAAFVVEGVALTEDDDRLGQSGEGPGHQGGDARVTVRGAAI